MSLNDSKSLKNDFLVLLKTIQKGLIELQQLVLHQEDQALLKHASVSVLLIRGLGRQVIEAEAIFKRLQADLLNKTQKLLSPTSNPSTHPSAYLSAHPPNRRNNLSTNEAHSDNPPEKIKKENAVESSDSSFNSNYEEEEEYDEEEEETSNIYQKQQFQQELAQIRRTELSRFKSEEKKWPWKESNMLIAPPPLLATPLLPRRSDGSLSKELLREMSKNCLSLICIRELINSQQFEKVQLIELTAVIRRGDEKQIPTADIPKSPLKLALNECEMINQSFRLELMMKFQALYPMANPAFFSKLLRKWVSLSASPQGSNFLAYPPSLVAFQLSVIESALVGQITSWQVLQHVSASSSSLPSAVWTRQPSPAIKASTDFFNYSSRVVQSTILETRNIKHCQKMVEFWINVCGYLFELNNFQTLQAILGGLSATPIRRLRRIWAQVGKKALKRLDQLGGLMSPCDNYSVYRNALGEMSKNRTWCIPYVGVYLMDATFILTALGKEAAPDHPDVRLVDLRGQIDSFRPRCKYPAKPPPWYANPKKMLNHRTSDKLVKILAAEAWIPLEEDSTTLLLLQTPPISPATLSGGVAASNAMEGGGNLSDDASRGGFKDAVVGTFRRRHSHHPSIMIPSASVKEDLIELVQLLFTHLFLTQRWWSEALLDHASSLKEPPRVSSTTTTVASPSTTSTTPWLGKSEGAGGGLRVKEPRLKKAKSFGEI